MSDQSRPCPALVSQRSGVARPLLHELQDPHPSSLRLVEERFLGRCRTLLAGDLSALPCQLATAQPLLLTQQEASP